MARKRGKSIQKRQNSLAPLFLIAAGVLLVVGVLGWRAFASLAGAPPLQASEVERVSLQEAKAAYDQGAAVIVDVRSSAAYDASHVPGAINIPEDELENRMKELDPKDWILTYCT